MKYEEVPKEIKWKKRCHSGVSGRERAVKTCVLCYVRKRKCDKVQPVCGTCKELGIPERCSWDKRLKRKSSPGQSEGTQNDKGCSDEAELGLPWEQDGIEIVTEDLDIEANTERQEENEREKEDEIDEDIEEIVRGSCSELLSGNSRIVSPKAQANESTGSLIRPGDVGYRVIFNGLNRTWFEFAMSRYRSICYLYGRPSVAPNELYNLFDLWHAYMSTSENDLAICTDTLEGRLSLYNTYHALAAFSFSCASSQVDMASHAKHVVNLTVSMARQVYDCIIKYNDPHSKQIAVSTFFLFKGLHEDFVAPRNVKVVQTIYADALQYMRGVTKAQIPAVSMHVALSFFFIGRGELALEYNLEARRREIIDPELRSSEERIQALLLDGAVAILIAGHLMGHYNPTSKGCRLEHLSFSSLPPRVQELWLVHCSLFELSYEIACTYVEKGTFEDRDAFMFMLNNMALNLGFSKYWVGFRSQGVKDILSSALQEVLLPFNNDNPFNNPYKEPLILGAHALVEMAPAEFVFICDQTGVMQTQPSLLSVNGKMIFDKYVHYYKRASRARRGPNSSTSFDSSLYQQLVELPNVDLDTPLAPTEVYGDLLSSGSSVQSSVHQQPST